MSMIRFGAPVLFFAVATSAAMGGENLYDADKFEPLVSDHKADSVGDPLTVLIVETSEAKSSADSNADRDTEMEGGLKDATGISRGSLDFERSFEGSGSTSREGRLTARISAWVVEVQANGNLRIAGRQRITVNGEEQRITLRGVVRPVDIDASNRVLSTRIADAEIDYSGAGFVDDSQRPGWVTRFINWLGF